MRWIALSMVAAVAAGCSMDIPMGGGSSFSNNDGKIKFKSGPGDFEKGTGEVGWHTVRSGSFDSLKIAVPITIELKQGAEDKVELQAQPNIAKLFEANTENGELSFKITKNFEADGPIALRITAKALKSINVTGAGSLTGTGIDSENLRIEAQGASKVILSGSADRVSAIAEGASTIDLSDFEVERADVESNGASRVLADKAKSITGSASGASKVQHGPGAKVDIQTSGASSVQERS